VVAVDGGIHGDRGPGSCVWRFDGTSVGKLRHRDRHSLDLFTSAQGMEGVEWGAVTTRLGRARKLLPCELGREVPEPRRRGHVLGSDSGPHVQNQDTRGGTDAAHN
jgi:hypothetical protein